jgi:hypothetical protein
MAVVFVGVGGRAVRFAAEQKAERIRAEARSKASR